MGLGLAPLTFRFCTEAGEPVREDGNLPVEEGDVVERKLPNGMIETYAVEERGFRKGMHSIPDHYQMKVRKVGTMRSKPNLRIQSWS